MELPKECLQYIPVDGPVNEQTSLIRYEVPFAPHDPKRSLRLRQSLSLGPETRAVDPNVRIVIDSFIAPRTWVADGVVWVQHASAQPASRVDVLDTQQKLRKHLRLVGARSTGVSPERSLLHSECALEVIRQVTAECWERGLLLLQVHSERVAALRAHRELFESRVGHAFRLALKGDKDIGLARARIVALQKRADDLVAEEEELKRKCLEFETHAEEQLLIDERRYAEETAALRKEGLAKRTQLEALTALPSR